MGTVTLDAAKEGLERLVARAAAGEVIVITVGSRPIAQIVPMNWRGPNAGEPSPPP